jgi:hypothetical protein
MSASAESSSVKARRKLALSYSSNAAQAIPSPSRLVNTTTRAKLRRIEDFLNSCIFQPLLGLPITIFARANNLALFETEVTSMFIRSSMLVVVRSFGGVFGDCPCTAGQADRQNR